MEPYADPDGQRVRIAGPDIDLPVRMVTPIGLIVHELATNAVKYGALSHDGGMVEIRWQVEETGPDAWHVELCWTETGGPKLAFEADQPAASGFGTQMTGLAARQIGGTLEREWPTFGAVARLRFPLDRAGPDAA